MKPKYLEPDTRNRDRWIVSYLDVLTILLIFFITAAMKTQSTAAPLVPPARPAAPAPLPTPPAPATAPAAAPAPAPVAAPTPLSDLQRDLEERGLDVRREQRGVVISLPQAILFASGDDAVSRDAYPIVEQVAEAIRDLPNPVILVGHADTVPIHNRRFRDNWELSAARSVRLLELLSRQYGIAESRLSVASEGVNQPRGSNETPDGRASNRRVEVVISGE